MSSARSGEAADFEFERAKAGGDRLTALLDHALEIVAQPANRSGVGRITLGNQLVLLAFGLWPAREQFERLGRR